MCRVDFVQRHVQREDIGAAQDLGQQAEAYAERILLGLREPRDIVVVHHHAEGERQPRHLLADRAEAHDAQHLVAHLVHRGRRVALPAAGRDVAVLGDQAARDREHQHECVLGDSHRIGAAVVAQRHLALAHGLKVGAVVAGAQHLDELEPGRVLEKPRRHVLLHEADEIVGAGQRRLHLG
jgi:hypothetical protein